MSLHGIVDRVGGIQTVGKFQNIAMTLLIATDKQQEGYQDDKNGSDLHRVVRD